MVPWARYRYEKGEYSTVDAVERGTSVVHHRHHHRRRRRRRRRRYYKCVQIGSTKYSLKTER